MMKFRTMLDGGGPDDDRLTSFGAKLRATSLRSGLSIYRSNDRVEAFDAVLAAVAIGRTHVRALVSADRGFADVDGLDHVDPGDPEAIERLLSD